MAKKISETPATGTVTQEAGTEVTGTVTQETGTVTPATGTETPAVVTPPQAVTHVVVYCNLPSGLSFRLPDGRKITFAGYPVSRLVGADGQALRAGKFGKTRNVRVEDWTYIASTYAGCAYFSASNPLLFAAASEADGDAMARELAETRSGLEQVDVRAPGGRTRPLDEDD